MCRLKFPSYGLEHHQMQGLLSGTTNISVLMNMEICCFFFQCFLSHQSPIPKHYITYTLRKSESKILLCCTHTCKGNAKNCGTCLQTTDSVTRLSLPLIIYEAAYMINISVVAYYQSTNMEHTKDRCVTFCLLRVGPSICEDFLSTKEFRGRFLPPMFSNCCNPPLCNIF